MELDAIVGLIAIVAVRTSLTNGLSHTDLAQRQRCRILFYGLVSNLQVDVSRIRERSVFRQI